MKSSAYVEGSRPHALWRDPYETRASALMLERYGIRYVLAHPEILLGLPPLPARDPAEAFDEPSSRPDYNALHPYQRSAQFHPSQAATLERRALEAHRLLNELYAP